VWAESGVDETRTYAYRDNPTDNKLKLNNVRRCDLQCENGISDCTEGGTEFGMKMENFPEQKVHCIPKNNFRDVFELTRDPILFNNQRPVYVAKQTFPEKKWLVYSNIHKAWVIAEGLQLTASKTSLISLNQDEELTILQKFKEEPSSMIPDAAVSHNYDHKCLKRVDCPYIGDKNFEKLFERAGKKRLGRCPATSSLHPASWRTKIAEIDLNAMIQEGKGKGCYKLLRFTNQTPYPRHLGYPGNIKLVMKFEDPPSCTYPRCMETTITSITPQGSSEPTKIKFASNVACLKWKDQIQMTGDMIAPGKFSNITYNQNSILMNQFNLHLPNASGNPKTGTSHIVDFEIRNDVLIWFVEIVCFDSVYSDIDPSYRRVDYWTINVWAKQRELIAERW
jgi:hypothetical protein